MLGSTKFQQLFSDGQSIYVVEGRPNEGGRCAIMRGTAGKMEEILPESYSARSKVHEYGGAPCAGKNGTIYFVNGDDQNIHILKGDVVSWVVTDPGIRFADLIVHPSEKWLYSVQEEHTREKVVLNTLTLVHLDRKNETQVVHSGFDFYAKPRISPDGKRIAFLAWNLPSMPWDEAVCFAGSIREDGTLADVKKIAGGDGASVNQITFAPDGTLYYTLDTSGWWDIYSERGFYISHECDFGYPDWIFGIHRMVFCGDKLLAIGTKKGIDTLYAIDTKTKSIQELSLPYSSYTTLTAANWKIYAVAASPTTAQTVIEIDVTRGTSTPLHSFTPLSIEETLISKPKLVETDTAFGFYYPPHNPDFYPSEGEKPPLIVHIHGGPTGHKDNSFSPQVQFWTSRGFGYLDVNHRGSTGNGRNFRNALNSNWGVLDVEDTCSLAQSLAQEGIVDGKRMIVTGGSAGGFTTLNCLAFASLFSAGISLYGIADLELLARDTHKFESKMLEQLVGPYPQLKDVYQKRSALYHIDSIDTPLLLLQGIEDTIVPPNQSEKMYTGLLEKGVPIAYVLFENEGHGFRRGPTLIRTYGAMLSFARKILSLSSDEHSEDIHIDNLDD